MVARRRRPFVGSLHYTLVPLPTPPLVFFIGLFASRRGLPDRYRDRTQGVRVKRSLRGKSTPSTPSWTVPPRGRRQRNADRRRARWKMVHGMDALSKKWRDDPVRAALEKKSSRDAAAERIAQANAIAGDILKKRLESQESSHAGSSSRRFDEEEGAAAGMSDADYRLALERQRKKLMDGDQSDRQSNISVFDPFQSKHDRRAEKAERKDKDRKRDKDRRSTSVRSTTSTSTSMPQELAPAQASRQGQEAQAPQSQRLRWQRRGGRGRGKAPQVQAATASRAGGRGIEE